MKTEAQIEKSKRKKERREKRFLEKYKEEHHFQDKRGRTWEWFIDECYYGLFCVRCISVENGRSFNSDMSFHFDKGEEGQNFIELIKKSS
jgi:hypothetical protein